MTKNLILLTDSYKIGAHWNMYPQDTQIVYSYFEARIGSKFPKTIFFGLQYLIKNFLEGIVITQEKIDEVADICKAHFGNETAFNKKSWEYILSQYSGRLPIRIKAVPEGSLVGVSNVLITIENTDEKCGWLTNYLESLISHIWYPIAVSSNVFEIKQTIKSFMEETSDNLDLLPFMLHGFGYRSYSSNEAAEIGSLAHLVHFKGTDDILSFASAKQFYNTDYNDLAYSVPASEHSVMSVYGQDGEEKIVGELLEKYPNGILSVVADTYDIYNFVSNIVGKKFKENIQNRKGIFVVRPDSITEKHPTKESLTLWIVQELEKIFGSSINSKGFKVLNNCVRVLYGDGCGHEDIKQILLTLKNSGYSTSNIATFGSGSGLVQKDLNRDTIRSAFKSSAQKRKGIWYDIQKKPLDSSKASKKGRLKLVKDGDSYSTVSESDPRPDVLVTVFENGVLLKEYTFAEVRANASR